MTCTKYRLQGLARAKFARAGGFGLSRGTRPRERGPCASALLPKRGLTIGEAVVPGRKGLYRQAGRLRVPQRSGRSPGSSDSARSQLQAGGPSSVPAPKCRQLAALGSYFVRGCQIQLCSTGARSFVAHSCTQPVYTGAPRPSGSIDFVGCSEMLAFLTSSPECSRQGCAEDCSLCSDDLGDS